MSSFSHNSRDWVDSSGQPRMSQNVQDFIPDSHPSCNVLGCPRISRMSWHSQDTLVTQALLWCKFWAKNNNEDSIDPRLNYRRFFIDWIYSSTVFINRICSSMGFIDRFCSSTVFMDRFCSLTTFIDQFLTLLIDSFINRFCSLTDFVTGSGRDNELLRISLNICETMRNNRECKQWSKHTMFWDLSYTKALTVSYTSMP